MISFFLSLCGTPPIFSHYPLSKTFFTAFRSRLPLLNHIMSSAMVDQIEREQRRGVVSAWPEDNLHDSPHQAFVSETTALSQPPRPTNGAVAGGYFAPPTWLSSLSHAPLSPNAALRRTLNIPVAGGGGGNKSPVDRRSADRSQLVEFDCKNRTANSPDRNGEYSVAGGGGFTGAYGGYMTAVGGEPSMPVNSNFLPGNPLYAQNTTVDSFYPISGPPGLAVRTNSNSVVMPSANRIGGAVGGVRGPGFPTSSGSQTATPPAGMVLAQNSVNSSFPRGGIMVHPPPSSMMVSAAMMGFSTARGVMGGRHVVQYVPVASVGGNTPGQFIPPAVGCRPVPMHYMTSNGRMVHPHAVGMPGMMQMGAAHLRPMPFPSSMGVPGGGPGMQQFVLGPRSMNPLAVPSGALRARGGGPSMPQQHMTYVFPSGVPVPVNNPWSNSLNHSRSDVAPHVVPSYDEPPPSYCSSQQLSASISHALNVRQEVGGMGHVNHSLGDASGHAETKAAELVSTNVRLELGVGHAVAASSLANSVTVQLEHRKVMI